MTEDTTDNIFNVAIVGGGPGSEAVMKLIMADTFRELKMNIVAVAIRNPAAPARRYAEQLGLCVTDRYKDLYEFDNLDLIIELTGSDEVLEEILKTKPSRVKVMDHVSARLFWDFIETKTREISWDISEKKKMERELKEHMEDLERLVEKRTEELIEAHKYTRGLIESSLDALVTFDKDGIITDVNVQTVRLTGCAREELIGSRFHNYFTDPERAAEGVRRSFEEGRVTDYELVMKSKQGGETVVSYNATVYKDEEGKVKGVFAAARDMTEVKKLQQQLGMAEKHVGIGRLAAGVAHEIKNQLAPTLIEVQRAMAHIEDDKRPSYEFILERARAIEEATRSANRITMALLDYARETRPQFASYDLEKSIEGVLSLHESRCRGANIQLKLETINVAQIYADKRQIEQVLVNIIDNAYEAIVSKGEAGVITVFVTREGPYAVISIQDTGTGIPEEDQTRIFDPFFTSRSPRGTGLGLSVIYGIVERHGGRINFESKPGEGSIFKVYLPIAPTKKEEKDALPGQDSSM